jgi:hypothetical protein
MGLYAATIQAMNAHEDIRIGTVVPAHEQTAAVIGRLVPLGFETFQLSFGRTVGSFDLDRLAAGVRAALEAHQPADGVPQRISCLGVYGNPLVSPETVADWERLIDAAPRFGCDLVAGFTGRIPGREVHADRLGFKSDASGASEEATPLSRRHENLQFFGFSSRRPARVEFTSRRSTVSSFELCPVHAPFYYLFHSYSRTLSLHGHPAPTRGVFATSPVAALYQPGWALWLPLRILAGQAACPPASESLSLTLAIRPWASAQGEADESGMDIQRWASAQIRPADPPAL